MKANRIVTGTGNEQWDRLPNKAYYYGCSRAFWYAQIRVGNIKSALIKKPGQVRGIRLVWRPSVLAFIEKYTVPKAG